MAEINDSEIKGKISMIFLERISELNDPNIKKSTDQNKKFNFSELAFNVQMRNATITEIIRCQSLPKFNTILKCLESLNLGLVTFSQRFENITPIQAQDHFEKMRELYPGKR